jgi:hypothetical protein
MLNPATRQKSFEKVGFRILGLFGFLWIAAAILELQFISR